MKLRDMSNTELAQAIEQLERTVTNNLDKYKRWEAEQKLKLAKAEQRKRNPIERIKRSFMNLFGN